MLFLLLALGCTDKGDSGASLSGDLILTDALTYRYTGSVEAEVIEVESQVDASVDWSALSLDLRQRSLSGPEAVEQAALLELYGSVEEIKEALSSNALKQSDIRDYRLFSNVDGASGAMLSDFSVLGNPFDPTVDLVDNGGSWIVSLIEGSVASPVVLSLAFLSPVVGAGQSEIRFTNDTAALDFNVDLRDSGGLATAAGLSYTVDWSGLTVDAVGNPFNPQTAQRLVVGHVPIDDPDQLTASFLQVFDLADGLWRLDVYGQTSAALEEATSEEGDAFPGFTVGGSWLVGLECPTCLNPAPPVLAVVTVVADQGA